MQNISSRNDNKRQGNNMKVGIKSISGEISKLSTRISQSRISENQSQRLSSAKLDIFITKRAERPLESIPIYLNNPFISDTIKSKYKETFDEVNDILSKPKYINDCVSRSNYTKEFNEIDSKFT